MFKFRNDLIGKNVTAGQIELYKTTFERVGNDFRVRHNLWDYVLTPTAVDEWTLRCTDERGDRDFWLVRFSYNDRDGITIFKAMENGKTFQSDRYLKKWMQIVGLFACFIKYKYIKL